MKRDGDFLSYVEMVARKYGGLEGLRNVVQTRLPDGGGSGLERVGDDTALERVSDDTGGTAERAARALEEMERGRDPGPSGRDALEAIIDADIRPVIDIVDGKFTSTHPLWTMLSTDEAIRGRLESCFKSIGRIELPGNNQVPYGGTGFIVGPGLVMTNRHVAEIFATGTGTRRVAFKPQARAGVDFVREYGRPAGTVYTASRVVMIHPYWDMALLAVDGLESRDTLKLSLLDARDLVGRDIAVVGYPAFDIRNPADVQNSLFAGRFGVKRLQPGELQGAGTTASFQKLVNAATHDCSTLGGNSGSAVIDLDTGEVIALHFGGRYRDRNYGVPSSELARDGRVADTGVAFAGTPSANGTDWADWWRRADEAEETAASGSDTGTASTISSTPTRTSASTTGGGAPVTAGTPKATVNASETLYVEIPIRVSISVGAPRPATVSIGEAAGAAVSEAEDALEAMREPIHDTDLGSRKGYDPGFLNTPGLPKVTVPMPTAADSSVLAKTLQGKDVLHYQNFSILMHAKRRLALVTASNVTREPQFRKPDPSKKYTREALSGLGPNDTERWFPDPRLDAMYQIPDVFFTKDRKAFDKGHIVRRDDVAWGNTYEELRRANGDTYHVTNCSPQTGAFNQFAKGEDNWGDLENHVLSEAGSERLCVLAGPVLDPNDQVFHGVGDGGVKLAARIPSRFWKVIVASAEDGLAAFGFVLEQDLGDVQFEFVVPSEFKPAMYPIADIAAMTGVQFDDAILEADQYDAVRGVETAFRGGIKRKGR